MHRFSIHAILWMTTLFACGACAIRWQQAEYRAAAAKAENDMWQAMYEEMDLMHVEIERKQQQTIDALKYQLAPMKTDKPKVEKRPFNGLRLGGPVVGGGGDMVALQEWEQASEDERRRYVDGMYGAGTYDELKNAD